MKIEEILKAKDLKLNLSFFAEKKRNTLENSIIERKGKYYTTCLVRKKEILLTPEEVVRQLFLMNLTEEYGYPLQRIELEYQVHFGREVKRADVVILDKDNAKVPYIIVELKKPNGKDGKEQLKSYCNATGAPIAVWTNGDQISYYNRKDPNIFEDLPNIPLASQKLSDILNENWTIRDLIEKDKLVKERKSLKDLILEMEDEVLANSGVDVFEEVFKLIFTKLYDEMESGRNETRFLQFRNNGDTYAELYEKIQNLFKKAKQKWDGVFGKDEKIKLNPSHLSVCVSSLQNVKLFNSNLEVVDEAFEFLINKSSKGEKGQYFTPRYVIDMCVKMLNPSEDETMIDTASGSCGFPVHTIFYVWQKIMERKGIERSHLFSCEQKPAECTDYVQNNVFAIDFDERAVRVARTLNLIAGDGQTNVLNLNTLDYESWDEKTQNETWLDTYNNGWKKLRNMRAVEGSNRDFCFDIVMANPPFAGDIKESRILAHYDLARSMGVQKLAQCPENATVVDHEPTFADALGESDSCETVYQASDGTFRKTKLKPAEKMSRHILFVERNLDFMRPGGRMAIVLPQGIFNNSSEKCVREYIADRCRILAVVGLHGNVFKPHTGTKTSVLFVQKWDEELCPYKEDYPIFFATMQEPSKDNSGDKIYCSTTDDKGDTVPLLDKHDHLIVKHDLFNHDGLTHDGIAEAFIEFARKENLSFFANSPFDAVRYNALLEGLEVSEVMLSEVLKRTKEFRLDSEPYQSLSKSKNSLETDYLENLVLTNPTKKEIAKVDKTIDISFIPMANLGQGVINEMIFDKLYKYEKGYTYFAEDDILIAQITPCMEHGKCAIARNLKNKIGFGSTEYNVFRPKDNRIKTEYLFAFLNREEIRKQAEINMVGSSGRQRVPIDFYKKLQIPLLPLSFQQEIERIVKRAHALLEESKAAYAAAESLLLDSLGLSDFDTHSRPAVNYNVKTLSESFGTTGRLDSEYYQDFYYEYEELIEKIGFVYVEDVCSDINYGTVPTSMYTEDGSGVPYIKGLNLKNTEVNTDKLDRVINTEQLPAKFYTKKGDIIISQMGTVGDVGVVSDEQENWLFASFTIRMRLKEKSGLNPHYVGMYIQHLAKKYYFLRNIAQASVRQNTDLPTVRKLSIPLLPLATQQQIAALVEKSFAQKRESKSLLQQAKQMVENEIEM